MSHFKKSDTLEGIEKDSLALMNAYLAACQVVTKYNKSTHANWQDIFNLEHIYKVWFSELTRSPGKLYPNQCAFMHDYVKLCQHVQDLVEKSKTTPVVQTQENDKRFKSHEWLEKPYYFYIHQLYLLVVKHLLSFIEENQSTDPKIAKQVAFFTKQYLDAMSPSNFMFTNPDAMKRLIETKGESFFHGMNNFYNDIKEGNGHFNISMTNMSAFKVGRDVAITPGKVIYQNRLCQLIQYSPTTEQVYERPLLMVPPWINKYYILDLKESNSFVRWIVEQGFTVFMISWVNPNHGDRDLNFDDYVNLGILSCLDAIKEATGEEQVNALGFCIGGTLLATTLAYMKAKNDHRIQSGTFLTTLIDFTDPGDMQVFIDEPQLQTLEQKMEGDGYLDGRVLMTTFNMLRVNDLVWPYYIHNYLCGKDPLPFDLLYWNADYVNLPQNMLSFYLRNMYLNNLLIVKNGISISNTGIDLSLIDIPTYFISTEQDHIAPWQSTYMGATFLNGPTTFVLGSSGHIAGVVNPPASHKYSYHYLEKDVKEFESPNDWFEKSHKAEGSWWVHWIAWLTAQSGNETKSRAPGSGNLQPIQNAPGDYVKKRKHKKHPT